MTKIYSFLENNIRLDLINSISKLYYHSANYEGFLVELFKKDPKRLYQTNFIIYFIDNHTEEFCSEIIVSKESIGFPDKHIFYQEYKKLIEIWKNYHNN